MKFKRPKINLPKTKLKVTQRKKKQIGFTTQLICSVMVMILIPVIVITAVNTLSTKRFMNRVLTNYSDRIMVLLYSNIDDTIKNTQVTLVNMMMSTEFKQFALNPQNFTEEELIAARTSVASRMDEMNVVSNLVDNIFIFKDGASYYMNVEKNNAEALRVADFVDTEPYLRLMEMDDTKNLWFSVAEGGAEGIYMGKHFVNKRNQDIVVAIRIKNDLYEKAITQADLQMDIPIRVVDNAGVVQMSNDDTLLGTVYSMEESTYAYLSGINSSLEQGYFMTDDRLVNYGLLSNGWKVTIDAPLDTLLSEQSRSNLIIAILAIVILGAAMAVCLYVSGMIAKPLKQLCLYMKQVKEGESRRTVGTRLQEEAMRANREMCETYRGVSEMLFSIDGMFERAITVAKSVREKAENLEEIAEYTADSSAEVEKAVDVIVQGAQEQMEQMESCTKAFEKLSAIIETTESSVLSIGNISNQNTALNRETKGQMGEMLSQTEKTVELSRNVYRSVESFGEEMENMQKVTDMIESINEQTDLLALNAKIEAARAGKAGGGFAVVANEVQNLAKQTQQAIVSVREMIERIGIKRSEAMEEVTKASAEFIKQKDTASQTKEILARMTEMSEKISELVTNIVQEIGKMVVEKDKLNANINEVGAVIETSVGSTEEVKATCTEQSEHADSIKRMVSELNVEMERLLV